MSSDSSNRASLDWSTASDADVLQAMRSGQADALSALYERYSRVVYALALRLLTHPQEAEDLTHEVFLSIWQRNLYNPDRGSLSSFLMMMTRSRAIDKLRSRGSKGRFLQRWKGLVRSDSGSPSPLEQLSIEERSQRVHEALAQIPDTERQVLEIAYFEGLSQSEIADRLNMPLGTVKSRSRQGLTKLRSLLQNAF